MNLNIVKGKTLQEANPSINVDEWYPELAKIPDPLQQLIVIVFDYDTVLKNLDPDGRVERASQFLGLSKEESDKISHAIIEHFSSNTEETEGDDELSQIYRAIDDYTRDQVDSFAELEDSLEKQITDISRQLRSTKITLNSDKDDKAFDRFNQMSKSVKDYAENIAYLRSNRQKTPNEIKDNLAKAFEELDKDEDHALATAHNGGN